EQRNDLQQMVLHDVTDRANLVVEAATPLNAEALGHRDLHAIDEIAVPDRLEEAIGETEIQQVLHCLLAEVVIDAEHRRLGEDLMQRAVEGLRGSEVAAERLLDDYPRIRGTTRVGQALHDGP